MEEIDDLLEDLKQWTLPREARHSLLNQLEDLFRRGRLEIGFAEGRIQNLLDTALYETDLEVRGRMFDVVERAMRVNFPLDIALDEMMAQLNDDDAALICHALLLMPLAAERKYLPLVEQYRAHPNEFVRRNAEYAWKYLNGGGRQGE